MLCSRLILPTVLLLLSAAIGFGQSPDDQAAREARLQAMKGIAERFKVQIADDEAAEPREAELIAAPLLRFNDPAREFHDATLWGWSSGGRPVCLLSIEHYGKTSMFEYISLFDRKLTAEAERVKWTPREPGLTLQKLKEAPAPAKEAPRRLVQMKDLLGALAVHEIGKNGARYELRLMPKPLHRYADEEDDVHDGAIFVFAYGTNPELLAVMESRGKASSPQWEIGFARCGTAEPHVMYKDREIFTLPYAKQSGAADPYWNFAYKFAEKK
jgi:hypothetical protein